MRKAHITYRSGADFSPFGRTKVRPTKVVIAIAMLVLLLVAGISYAQDCERNMLFLPDSSSLAVVPNTTRIDLKQGFTIEWWMKADSFVPNAGIIEQSFRGDTGAISIRYGSTRVLAITLKLNTGIVNLTTPSLPTIQNWNHFAITFTPNDSIKVYINGDLVLSEKTNATTVPFRADTLFIGHSQLTAQTFLGDIDELRFWSVARTQKNIQDKDSIPLTGREQNLTAYYRFDDRTEVKRIHDFTDHGSEGIILQSGECIASTTPVSADKVSGYMLASIEKVVDLGTVLCSQSVKASIHLYNRGFDTLQVGSRGFVFGGKIFNVVDDAGFPLVPDSSKLGIVNVQVDFHGAGTFTDTLIVSSSTVCGGSVRIPFKIRFEEVNVAFDDSLYQFPRHVDCDTSRPEKGIELQNNGSVAVTIDSAFFTSNVGVELVSPKAPFVIDSGKSVVVTLRQNPGGEGDFSTTLRLRIKECSRFSELPIKGKRTHAEFSIPERIEFPLQHYTSGGISLDTFFVLRNTGSEELFAEKITVKGKGFHFTPSSLYQYPGESDTVWFRFDTTSCGTFQGSIHISGKPCNIDTSIPILITIAGPELTPKSSLLDIGAACVTKDTIVTFVNRSTMKIRLNPPMFNKPEIFSLVDPNDLPREINPGDTIHLRLRFAPSTEGEKFSQAKFQLLPCGEITIDLRGIRGVGKMLLSNSSLEFGHQCDLAEQKRQISLKNEAGRSVTITTTDLVGSNNFTLVDQLPLTIASGESKLLTIRYAPTSLSADDAEITLREDSCYITSFGLHGTREHANVTWKRPVINFDTTCPGRISQSVAELHNHGTSDQTIESFKIIGPANVFTVQNPVGRVLVPGTTESFFVDFQPVTIGNVDAIVEFVLLPCNDTTQILLRGVGGPKPQMFVSEKELSFGKRRAGTRDTMCVTISNPSCLPLTITKESVLISLGQKSFSLTEASIALLPAVISDSNSFTLCVVFHPSIVSSSRSRVLLSVGDIKDTITLSGDGVAPAIFYVPESKFIDFGDVLTTKSSTKSLKISNISGGDSTGLSFPRVLQPSYIISPSPLPTHLERNSDTTLQITFAPDTTGLVIDTLLVQWDLGVDTIILSGRGVDPGVQLSNTQIQFSDIRVGRVAVDTLIVSASEGWPITLNNTFFSGMDSDQFTVRALQPSEMLTDSTDTLRYELHFMPDAERVFESNFVVGDDKERGRIGVSGRGVEAHIVLLDTPLVDFSTVNIGTTFVKNVRIFNSGSYPLQLDDVTTSLTDIYQVVGVTNNVVPPGDTVTVPVTFEPKKAILYSDVLTVYGDAPEQQATLWLRGTGSFGTQPYPLVTYDITDAETRVGEILDIPIYIGGGDLSLLKNVDTFAVRLQYDPSVVFVHGVSNENTILQPMNLTMIRERHDSAVLITANGAAINPRDGILLYVRVEALLGANDSTRIEVVDASPQNTLPTFQSSGLYYVTDCGNYRTNITYKGPYSVSPSSPNPASNTITISYEIGLDGYVSIDLYDGLGKIVRSLVNQNQKAGKYTVQKTIDDLPSGEYIYILRSLEYQGQGKIIIAK